MAGRRKWWLPAKCYVMVGQVCKGEISRLYDEYQHSLINKIIIERPWREERVSIITATCAGVFIVRLGGWVYYRTQGVSLSQLVPCRAVIQL